MGTASWPSKDKEKSNRIGIERISENHFRSNCMLPRVSGAAPPTGTEP